jgi:hypothetical protein
LAQGNGGRKNNNRNCSSVQYNSRKSHTLDKIVNCHHGRPPKKLSIKQEEIQFKLCISLCKNIVPKTDCPKIMAFIRVLQELANLGVSQRYVGAIWRKHKEDNLDPLNEDLYVSMKH